MANVISNYVKFRRGNPEAFKNLAHKEPDTLYFIYEEDALNGELYLGEKLIAGAGEVNGATSLRGLLDTYISEKVNADSFLVYDIAQGKWVDKPVDDILSAFVGTAGDRPGIAGLVPAPEVGQGNYFLRGDGTWAEVVTASAVKIYQTVRGTSEEPVDAIDRVLETNNAIPNNGDIIVLKDLIAEDKYQHTSYVFNGTGWVAMDGNYDAESVYFDNDLTFTYAFGRYTPDSSGSVVVPAKGINLKALLEDAYSQEEKTGLVTEEPAASINGSIKYYEVGTTGTQDITVSLSSDGAYKYGYSSNPTSGEEGEAAIEIVNNGVTGVGADTSLDAPYELIFNGVAVSPKTAKGATFTIAPEVQLEKTEMSAQGTVHHIQGYIPVSNLGKMYPSQRIAAGDKVSSSQVRARWYIPMYQGFTYADSAIADPAAITGAELVALAAPSASTSGAVNKITGSKAYDKTKTLTATASKSWRQYFLAIPQEYGWEMTNAKDSNNIDCTVRKASDVTLTFGEGEKTVDVVYDVYYIHNAADYGTLKITWTM